MATRKQNDFSPPSLKGQESEGEAGEGKQLHTSRRRRKVMDKSMAELATKGNVPRTRTQVESQRKEEGRGHKEEKEEIVDVGEKRKTTGARKRRGKEEKGSESAPLKGEEVMLESVMSAGAQVRGNRRGKRASSKMTKASASGKRENMEGEQQKYVGAHMSIAGGIWNAVADSVTIGGRAFALFLGSQRTWHRKPIDEKAAAKFRQTCKEHGFSPDVIIPHGSYLMNCGSPNPVFQKSRFMLVDELRRCEALGLTMFNFHPGSTLNEISIETCLHRIADCINYAHQQTKGVTTVIENMSCQGNTVGGRFQELRGIIDGVEDKSRVGVCLDTCHAFAAGYNLSTEDGLSQMLEEFESVVGLQYLKAVHLNDSKGKLGCHLDRHENIGRGYIGLDGFRRIMNEPRFNNIPMILETPARSYDDVFPPRPQHVDGQEPKTGTNHEKGRWTARI
nr:PREDICTED: probable endonuclease 4 isoform X2 [Latimeria chalumnae]|eukprot:XP_005994325.1 PREDICTED: probable endonuclease 4 isoform X2 [Latimeria chalumnae]